MPTASGSLLRSWRKSASRQGVESRIVPGVFELLDGNVSVNRLRQVDIADLLRRTPVVSSPDARRFVRDRRCW